MLLRLRSWQLFILFMLPLVWQGGGIITSAVDTVGLAIFSRWVFEIGYYGQRKIHSRDNSSRSTTLLTACCIMAPILYIILTVFYEPVFLADAMEYVMVPLALGFSFAMIYSLSFSASTLKGLNDGNELSFRSRTMNFLMLLFVPIGVWFIQPKVKEFI